MLTIKSKKAQDTFLLGKKIGEKICVPITIALKGELGAGKTTFVQGLAKGLRVSSKYYITSPTFSLINEYPIKDFVFFHLDFYRLSNIRDLDDIGLDDIMDKNHIVAIEWPEILDGLLEFDIQVNFVFDKQYNRIISLSASGQSGVNLISKISS